MLLRSRRTKRGGIKRERHLSMRVLSVVPRYAVTVGSLLGGTVIGKTPEERGKLHLVFFPTLNVFSYVTWLQDASDDAIRQTAHSLLSGILR